MISETTGINAQAAIMPAQPEDAAALLEYLKIVGGETENLSFGAEDVPLSVGEEEAYLRSLIHRFLPVCRKR